MYCGWLPRVARFVGLTVLGLALGVLSLTAAPARAADDEAGFTSLFDGKTLSGWDGDPDHWRVEDGLITGENTLEKPLKTNSFLIWRQGEVDDFELCCDYRFQSEWGNSGIQYRSFEDPQKMGKWVVGGYQADCETGVTHSGGLYGERFRGIIGGRGQKVVIGTDHKPKLVERFADAAKLQEIVKANDWNSYRIVARGFHLTLELNGHLTSDVMDEDLAVRRRGGIIALQLHAGKHPMKVQFRNIRLKRLKMEGVKKIVFVAGHVSHGYAQHEHIAGCRLLAGLINANVPQAFATAYCNGLAREPLAPQPAETVKRDGWPQDPTAFDNADAVVIYSDGGAGHPMMAHLDQVAALVKRGVGLGCIHYAVEIPKGQPGDSLKDWIGGYFETFWSVNPHWHAVFSQFPEHPTARGLKPFEIDDEWYFHMRFRDGMQGVTPILTAIPPDAARAGKDNAHGGNPTVRAEKGRPEHLGWVCQRADGGRGFGFTGGHFHWNWAQDNFRTFVLNAIVWIAGLDVPEGGVPSKAPTLAELKAGVDKPEPPPSKSYDPAKVQQLIDSFQAQRAK